MVQHFLVDLFTYADLVNFTLNAQHALYPQVKRQVIDVLSCSVKGRFSLIVSFERGQTKGRL